MRGRNGKRRGEERERRVPAENKASRSIGDLGTPPASGLAILGVLPGSQREPAARKRKAASSPRFRPLPAAPARRFRPKAAYEQAQHAPQQRLDGPWSAAPAAWLARTLALPATTAAAELLWAGTVASRQPSTPAHRGRDGHPRAALFAEGRAAASAAIRAQSAHTCPRLLLRFARHARFQQRGRGVSSQSKTTRAQTHTHTRTHALAHPRTRTDRARQRSMVKSADLGVASLLPTQETVDTANWASARSPVSPCGRASHSQST